MNVRRRIERVACSRSTRRRPIMSLPAPVCRERVAAEPVAAEPVAAEPVAAERQYSGRRVGD
jgi:hypothetical protein